MKRTYSRKHYLVRFFTQSGQIIKAFSVFSEDKDDAIMEAQLLFAGDYFRCSAVEI